MLREISRIVIFKYEHCILATIYKKSLTTVCVYMWLGQCFQLGR
jgi:hypothetical protein